MGHHLIAGEGVASLELEAAAPIEIEAERMAIPRIAGSEHLPVVGVQGKEATVFARRLAMVEIHPRCMRPLGDRFGRNGLQRGPRLTAIVAGGRDDRLREDLHRCRTWVQGVSGDHADCPAGCSTTVGSH